MQAATKIMECLKQILGLFSFAGEFFAAIAGAFAGAYAAFAFQNSSEEKKKHEARRGAILVAQGAAHSQWRVLEGIKKEYIDANNLRQSDTTNMVKFLQAPSAMHFDIPSIAFLMEGTHANLVQDIQVAEGSFKTAMLALEHRHMLIAKIFRESEREIIDQTKHVVRVKGDFMDLGELRQVTTALCETTDEAAQRCEALFYALKDTGKALYPGYRFLDLEGHKRSA